MKKINEKDMEILIDSFNKVLNNNDSKKVLEFVVELNNVFISKFGKTKIDYMFKIDNYACLVSANFIAHRKASNALKVYFHRVFVRRDNKKRETKFSPDFSHELKFNEFCYRYCNPDIVFIIEKILFQLA